MNLPLFHLNGFPMTQASNANLSSGNSRMYVSDDRFYFLDRTGRLWMAKHPWDRSRERVLSAASGIPINHLANFPGGETAEYRRLRQRLGLSSS